MLAPAPDLTFSAAMALDPSEVEVCLPLGGRWTPLADHEKTNFYLVRHAQFRLRRPRKSRVQEMAEKFAGKALYVAGLEEAIRAVIEYLPAYARDIESEFLEPR